MQENNDEKFIAIADAIDSLTDSVKETQDAIDMVSDTDDRFNAIADSINALADSVEEIQSVVDGINNNTAKSFENAKKELDKIIKDAEKKFDDINKLSNKNESSQFQIDTIAKDFIKFKKEIKDSKISSDKELKDSLFKIKQSVGSGISNILQAMDLDSSALADGYVISWDAALNKFKMIASGGGSVDSVNGQTGIVVLDKTDIGLGNVDNTSDANKPVSTATQTALNLKANLASPTFTGVVKTTTGTKTPTVGGKIKEYYTNAGNTTTVETDLYSYTTEASLLGANGDVITGEYTGTFAISATATRQLKLYFGGTNIFDTGAFSSTVAYDWNIDFTIIRVSSTTIRYKIVFNAGNFFIYPRVLVGEVTGLTLSNTNILKLTGTAAGSGAATDDIIAKMGYIEYLPVSV